MAPDDAFSRLTSPPGGPYLCASCIDAFSEIGDECAAETYINGHLTYSGFLEAVANKCFICWRLFQTLDSTRQECLPTLARYEHPRGDHSNPLTSLVFGQFYKMYYYYQDRVDMRSELHTNCWTRNFDPETLPDLAHAIEVMDQGRDVGFNYSLVKMGGVIKASEVSQWRKSCAEFVDATAWEESIGLIKQWLHACSSGHRQCNDCAGDTSWFPTRVLDLGPLGSTESDGTAVKIIARKQVVPGNRYVTLSHRWNRHIPKLTSSNLKAWLREIPAEALTKTYRDFITVSRLLGFRYAWIDSLCIIQESEHGGSDWIQECQTMDLIYRNSFCNLSADWPTDSDGFFLDRKVRQVDLPIVEIKFGSPPTSEDSEDSEKREFEYLLVDNGTWQCEVTNSPVNSRGWVLQERFLSPRVLHFCRNEVIFECCKVSTSERFRQPMPNIDDVAFEPFKNFGETLDGRYDTAACHRMWDRVSGIYSRCALTYAEDKLVAISGIARYLKTFLVDDVYVMGVWASAISTRMLWSCEENTIRDRFIDRQTLGELKPLSELAVQTVSTPLRQRKGPTFSWVSTDTSVYFPPPGFPSTCEPVCESTRLVKYREAQIPFDDEPITEDIFDYPGQPMVELKMVSLLRLVRLIDTGKTYFDIVFLDGEGRTDGDDNSLRRCGSGIVRLDFTTDPSEILNIESRVFFCIIWTDNGHWSTSIILELVDLEMGRFRRIGKVWHFSPDLQPLANIPGCNYNPETQKHTIYII